MERHVIVWVAVVLNATFLLLFKWTNLSGSWLSIICIFNVILVLRLNYFFGRLLRQFYLLTEHSGGSKTLQDSIKNYLVYVKEFVRETKQVVAGIKDLGDPQFTTLLNTIKSEDIRSPLCAAHDKILTLRKADLDRSWIAQGVASIAEFKQMENDTIAYCDHVLGMVIKYLNANQGALFLLRNDQENCYLELATSYAYGRKKFSEQRISIGQGLAGQVVLDPQIIYMTDVPKNYIKITSGLGEALPECICIVPLLFDGNVYGVLELATFQPFQAREKQYLEKISESIGYNLAAIEGHRKTEMLLQQSQKMSQEVKAQEEELRQNMEELRTTQEQMKKKEYEMTAVLSSLSTVELDKNGIIMDANEIFLGVTGFKIHELHGRPYETLIPRTGNDLQQYELMLNSILTGRTFSGEFRIVDHRQKEVWMAGNFTPIMDDAGNLYKIMIVSVFITQDKEKLNELQELVSALRSCFPMAEINPDISFKTANDLFLSEVGIRRLELKKSSPKSFFEEDSFKKLEKYIQNSGEIPGNLVLTIQPRQGGVKHFNSTLININNTNDDRNKGLLILRNQL